MKYNGFHRAIGILHRENSTTWPICLCNEVEADALDRLRSGYTAIGLQPPSYTAMVIKAAALAIAEVSRDYPEINSFLSNVPGFRRIHYFDTISAGCVVSLEADGDDQAYMAVVQRPHERPLAELTEQLQASSTSPANEAGRVNSRYLYRLPRIAQEVMLWFGRSMPELRAAYRGTFAITTVGKFGVDYQLTLPQPCSLQFGFGVIRERPVVRDGTVVAARTFFLTLSFDRRLMNGKPCALLMERIREILHTADFREPLPASRPVLPAVDGIYAAAPGRAVSVGAGGA